jgi:hypothetical protein
VIVVSEVRTEPSHLLYRAFGCFVFFLIVRLNAFTEANANPNDTGMHEVRGAAANTASWETRDLPDIRLRFKLPPGYKQKQWAVIIRSGPIATFQLGHLNEINFAVENAEDKRAKNAKVMPQKDYVDYKEWSQLIGGRDGIVQTFQGGGEIIDEEGKRLPYRVEATCALDGKHLLWINATLGNDERQQELLAMLKTFEFY